MYGSPYGSSYGSTYNRYGSSPYGSSYGGSYGSSMYGSPYGSSYGSRYGGTYGSSMYGSSMYGNSMYNRYGSSYGSRYGGYGGGYDDFRNPYPRGKYWSYGSSPEDEPVDEFGNPIGPDGPGSWLMDMENVVEGFGHFTRILDYNFEAMHGSFASVLRLFDSVSELRRAIYYGLQGFAIFTLLGKALVALQKFIYKLLGKPIPERLKVTTENITASLEDQWSGSSTAVRITGPQRKHKFMVFFYSSSDRFLKTSFFISFV
jgi:peroxin-13